VIPLGLEGMLHFCERAGACNLRRLHVTLGNAHGLLLPLENWLEHQETPHFSFLTCFNFRQLTWESGTALPCCQVTLTVAPATRPPLSRSPWP